MLSGNLEQISYFLWSAGNMLNNLKAYRCITLW